MSPEHPKIILAIQKHLKSIRNCIIDLRIWYYDHSRRQTADLQKNPLLGGGKKKLPYEVMFILPVWSSLRRGVWRGKITRICKIHRLHRPVKNFLEVIHICSGYPEGPPRSGLSNALTFMIIRCVDQKIFAKNWLWWKKKTSEVGFWISLFYFWTYRSSVKESRLGVWGLTWDLWFDLGFGVCHGPNPKS